MTEVNVSATVGMSATVGEMYVTVRGNVHDSGGMSATVGGNVHNSGEIEYGLGNLRAQIVIYNSAYINSEDSWNNM